MMIGFQCQSVFSLRDFKYGQFGGLRDLSDGRFC